MDESQMEQTNNSETAIPEIELIIKASTIDGKRKGACILCQELIICLQLLSGDHFSVKLTTLETTEVKFEFEDATPPILIDGEIMLLENEDIKKHINKLPGGTSLFIQDMNLSEMLDKVSTNLKQMLLEKDGEDSHDNLCDALTRINSHLEKQLPHRYLTGDTMCCFDCELQPMLQHIRVAGYLASFDIPITLKALWRYIAQMGTLEVFLISCPDDQEIINYYKDIRGDRFTRREELSNPSYTTSVPTSGLPTVPAGTSAENFKEFVDNAGKIGGKDVAFLANNPLKIGDMVKSTCLVTSPTSQGTGFLATVTGFDGVILFSAGHMFTSARDDHRPLDERIKSYVFRFNCMDGCSNNRNSIRVSGEDLLRLKPQPKILANWSDDLNLKDKTGHMTKKVVRLEVVDYTGNMTEEAKKLPRNQDYFAMILDSAGRKYLAEEHGLNVYLACPETNEWADVEREGSGVTPKESLFYAGYPVVIEDDPSECTPLRFSFGVCLDNKPKDIQIGYNLVTQGGASGSPVMDSQYNVIAIHVNKDNRDEVNRGTVLRLVYQNLKKVKAL